MPSAIKARRRSSVASAGSLGSSAASGLVDGTEGRRRDARASLMGEHETSIGGGPTTTGFWWDDNYGAPPKKSEESKPEATPDVRVPVGSSSGTMPDLTRFGSSRNTVGGSCPVQGYTRVQRLASSNRSSSAASLLSLTGGRTARGSVGDGDRTARSNMTATMRRRQRRRDRVLREHLAKVHKQYAAVCSSVHHKAH